MSKPVAWSYSALSTFESCPKKYYHLRVVKDVKDGDSEDAAEGKKIHDAMYKRVIKGTPLPMEYQHFERIAKSFANLKGDKNGELKLALNKALEPVDFFARDVWVRAVADLTIQTEDTLLIVDWKTGKQKNDYTQLKLTAAVLAPRVPQINRFVMAFAWLRDGVVSSQEVDRGSLLEVWNDLLPRVNAIEHAAKTTSFPAKPSGLCRGWCPVTQCPHFSLPNED